MKNPFLECKRCGYDNEKEDMKTKTICKDCYPFYLKERKQKCYCDCKMSVPHYHD